ncbi:MAG: reverse transcriptase domain-containing protein [bacterium]
MTYTDKPFHDAITLRPSVSYISKPSTSHEHTGDIITYAFQDNDQEQIEEGCKALSESNNYEEETRSDVNIFIPTPPTPEPEQEVYDDGAPSEDQSSQRRMTRQRKTPTRLHYHQLGESQIWSGAQKQAHTEGERLLIVECAREAIAGERTIDAPGSDPSPFSPPPSNMAAMLRLSNDTTKQAWLRASRKEIKNLVDNGTFLLQDPKADEKVTPCMDTYRAKLKSDGTLDKQKVRIVVRGDLQKQQSKEDTWSPTASVKLLKMFLAHAARMKCRVKQLDFIGALFQANVRERIFVKLPAKYGELFPEYSQYCGRPLRLAKSMYGMIHSGRFWWEELLEWLLSIGFTSSSVHPCLLWKTVGNSILLVLDYVDDMLYYFSTSKAMEDGFVKELATRFKAEFLGQAHWFLSLQISQSADYSITVDQSRYAKAITARYTNKINALLADKYDRALPPLWIASKEDCSASEADSAKLEKYYNLDYRSCTGALIYLNFTRPDIVFAVMKLVKFSNNPGKSHFEALIHLLGYIRDNASLGLRFYSNLEEAPVTKLLKEHNITPRRALFSFSDSSWQDCPDTGRSTGSNVIFYQGGVVDHSSFVPGPVAMSSGEAEYNAACVTCMATAHFRMVTNEMDTLADSDPQDQAPVAIILTTWRQFV